MSTTRSALTTCCSSAAGLALLVLPAIAKANYSCAGTVNNLALNPDGVLTATIGSLQNVYLCQIGATRNGVSSDVCKAILAHG